MPDAHRLLVEVPDTGFRPHWEAALLKRLTDVMRQRCLSCQKARAAAQTAISRMQEMASMRMRT